MQTTIEDAINRSCDNQHNDCADVANKQKGSLTVGDCDKQNGERLSLPNSTRYARDADAVLS